MNSEVIANRPRVLHVITVLGLGGVELWLIALLRENKARRERGEPFEEIDILMTGGRTAVLDEIARDLGAQLHYIPFSRKTFAKFSRKFRELLKERKYTVIHDHQDYIAAWHFIAGGGSLPPVRIVHVHNPTIALANNANTPLRRVLMTIAKRIVRRRATHVLGTSSQAIREYGFFPEEFPEQRIRALHCGFDVTEFAGSHEMANASVCEEFGWPRGSSICVFVGRLDGFDKNDPTWNHKNPEFALEVARESILMGSDIKFILAGDGEAMREKLTAKVRSWGMENRIVLPGKRLDVPRLMAAAGACLFPSLQEGLGMVAVEAQAAGLRVLASDRVPREASVISDQITFLPLSAGAKYWADELARQIALPRADSSRAASEVRKSEFSIDRSYQNLYSVYSSG